MPAPLSRLPHPGKLAEIMVALDRGEWEYGSGYEVAPGLVLTAAHVLRGRDRALVRFNGGQPDERELDGTVAWRPLGLDLALVDVGSGGDVRVPTVAFADPERAAGEVAFRAVGFPLFKRVATRDGPVVRDSDQIDGTIALLADLKSRTLALKLRAGAPRALPPGASPWKGMSGAAVFSGGALVGIVLDHRLAEGDAALAAVRVAAIDDPRHVLAPERDRFRALLGLPPAPFPALRADGEPGSRRVKFNNLIERHRVFGGRQAELDQLTALADIGHCGYVLVSGLSGMGKTALLTNWARRRETVGSPTCTHFISRRDGTAGEEDTLANLCEQLARIRGLPVTAAGSLPDLQARYIRLLAEPLPPGARVAVVIDALDEASWTPVPALFPPLPDGVLVVLSARERADVDWLDQLGLAPDTPTISLGRLSASDVDEVLAALDTPPRLRSPEATAVIMEKSGGEPYYLALLARDIKRGALCTPSQLRRWPSGLRGYFDHWWEETIAVDPRGVSELFAYLLAAVGPVPREDLVNIELHDALDSATIDAVVDRAGGHVIGDADGGYQLAHPRFGEYLELHRIGDAERGAARAALLTYCERKRASPSTYVLREFAELLSAMGQVDRLLELIDDPEWYDSQLADDPSGGGYVGDVRLAWEATHELAAVDAARDESSRWIGREVRCALAVASMRSRLSGIPAALLGILAREGLWSERSVLATIRDAPGSSRRVAALEAVIAELSPAGLREALALARGLPLEVSGAPSPRMSALAVAAEHMAGDEREATARELFDLRDQVRDAGAWLRFVARPAITGALPGELLRDAIRAAGPAATAADIVAIVGALHDAEGDAAALAAVHEIGDDGCRAEAIGSLAGRFSVEATASAACLAADLPVDGPSGSPRARALGALAQWLEPTDATMARQAVAAVSDVRWRAWAELHLAAGRSAEETEDALRRAAAVEDPSWRLRVIVSALPILTGKARDEAFATALDALRATPDVRSAAVQGLAEHLVADDAERVLAVLGGDAAPEELTALVPPLTPERRVAVLTPAIERRANDPASALALMRLLPDDVAMPLVRRQLDALRDTPEPDAALVGALADYAPDAMLGAVREAAVRLGAEGETLDILSRLLERSPVGERDELFDAALAVARKRELRAGLFETASRAEALTRLLALAPPERFDDLLAETLAAAEAVVDDALRVRAEIALLPAMPADAQAALAARVAEFDANDRYAVLVTLNGPLKRDAALHLVDTAQALPLPHALETLIRMRARIDDPNGVEAATNAARRAIARLPPEDVAWTVDRVPDDLLADLVDRAAALPPSRDVVRGLVAAAARAPEVLGPKVTRIAVGLAPEPEPEDPPGMLSLRALALHGLAPVLNPAAAQEALTAIEEIKDPTSRVHAWVAVAGRLPEPARSQAAGTVVQLVTGQPARALVELAATYAQGAPESSASIVADAFAAVRERAGDDGELAQAIFMLGPDLSETDAAEALDLTRSSDMRLRLAGVELVGRLAADRRPTAIADLLPDVAKVELEEHRCELLTTLGAAAPAELRGPLLERALYAAAALGDEGTHLARAAIGRVDIVPKDAVSLSVAWLREALAMDDLTPQPPRGAPVPTLSLPLTGRPEGLLNAEAKVGSRRQMPSGGPGIRADEGSGLVAIVQDSFIIRVLYDRREQLPAPAQIGAFESALARLRRKNAQAWTELAQQLLEHLPVQNPAVLATVEAELGRRVHRAIALELLAPPLPVWFTPTLNIDRGLREIDRSTRLLRAIVPMLAKLDRVTQHEVWSDFLGAFSAEMRPSFLVDLRNMTPVTLLLGDGAGAEDAALALRFAGQQWP